MDRCDTLLSGTDSSWTETIFRSRGDTSSGSYRGYDKWWREAEFNPSDLSIGNDIHWLVRDNSFDEEGNIR